MAYRFGRFVLDVAARELRADGAAIHLSPKAFDLLEYLLVNRRRAVSKAELLDRLWPSTFVEETNLAGLAAEIRRAIGDSASQHAFLRTVHRFGYQFAGACAETADTDGPTLSRMCVEIEGRRIPLTDGSNVIGRSLDATIQCDVSGVSRHHARLLVSGGQATIEDLGSKNGTLVGHLRITAPTPLSDGDVIHLGRAVVTFRRLATPGPTETLSRT